MSAFHVDVGDVRLQCRRDGPQSGTPVLLLNSLGTDLSMWDRQVAEWSRHRPVLRFDSRGHGASSVPPPPYILQQLGRDALAVLDHLGLEQVDLCGLSLGGVVALWIAGYEPQRVRRAVFAATGSRIGDASSWQQRADAVLAGGMEAVADVVIERFFSPGFRRRDPGTVAAVRRRLLRMDPTGYAGACLALADSDAADVVGRVRAPALVIGGGQDVATPPGVTEELSRALVDATHTVVDGAGHLVNIEAPEQFSVLVHRFLSTEARSGRHHGR